MADTLEKFTRTIKKFYEEAGNILTAGKQGIDQFLFQIDDLDESANFAIDDLIANPSGVAYRHPDEQSHVRKYEPGTGNNYEVPHTSEKTPITEQLMDSVVAGIESTASVSSQNQRRIQQIVNQHIAAHTATRWKYAIDVIRTGEFSPTGIGGRDIGISIDFGRTASLGLLTYDFTALNADMATAMGTLIEAYVNAGGNTENLCVIMGSSWLKQFTNDSEIIAAQTNNLMNLMVKREIMPPELFNTQGLKVVAEYNCPDMPLYPVLVCGFQPRYQFVAYEGASAAPFIPADEAIIFSIGDPRYRVFRGVDALDGNERSIRTVGEIVLDSFTSKDPVGKFIRSQSRNAFVPANPNATARITGTFSSSES